MAGHDENDLKSKAESGDNQRAEELMLENCSQDSYEPIFRWIYYDLHHSEHASNGHFNRDINR